MSDVSAKLLTTLRSLIGTSCERSLAVNSLKLRFDCAPREKGQAYIWIEPPWRLSLNGQFVTGSADCPAWDGTAEPQINRPLWEAWSALFDPLNRTTLIAIKIGSLLPDLTLDFESGYRIETFGNHREDNWWYFRNRVTGELFEAGGRWQGHRASVGGVRY